LHFSIFVSRGVYTVSRPTCKNLACPRTLAENARRKSSAVGSNYSAASRNPSGKNSPAARICVIAVLFAAIDSGQAFRKLFRRWLENAAETGTRPPNHASGSKSLDFTDWFAPGFFAISARKGKSGGICARQRIKGRDYAANREGGSKGGCSRLEEMAREHLLFLCTMDKASSFLTHPYFVKFWPPVPVGSVAINLLFYVT